MADKKPGIIANPQAPEILADRATSVAIRGNVARLSFGSQRPAGDPNNPDTVVSGHVAL